ncbi:peptidylprolyl isomerase [Accumulibacter sp.]|uniref:FKBP-type peptidyl-prolyl cis-trans isomerase n=1 Tax=Accumulibacter sp. TaxID=2053492 RepID=UPI0025CD4DDE|nr:peptidylprolyl isomerase [Accumulibacter sp.]MCM8596640.1 peptidylprolyl isomerase [Accumulibacter sp.]MCM8627559.1 peptidylprolyl isomerase [Accumulibacter sp.]MDS4050788.1 peptidylprolyl isomerase [Accumulibacter sp.]
MVTGAEPPGSGERPPAAPVVEPDSHLTLHYRLADREGNDYVSTFDLSPATLQMGSGELGEPLERCLLGLSAGERHIFDLDEAGAFGPYNPRLVERIALSALPPGIELQPNSLVEFESVTPGRTMRFAGFLREISESSAVFDFNHPLAGKALRFEVQIIAIL